MSAIGVPNILPVTNTWSAHVIHTEYYSQSPKCRGSQNICELMFQVTALESHWSQPKGNSYQYFHMPGPAPSYISYMAPLLSRNMKNCTCLAVAPCSREIKHSHEKLHSSGHGISYFNIARWPPWKKVISKKEKTPKLTHSPSIQKVFMQASFHRICLHLFSRKF